MIISKLKVISLRLFGLKPAKQHVFEGNAGVKVYIGNGNCKDIHGVSQSYERFIVTKPLQPHRAMHQNTLSKMEQESEHESNGKSFGIGYIVAPHCLHNLLFIMQIYHYLTIATHTKSKACHANDTNDRL